ncbi:MAG: peptidoglycan DD-metalloendopeptidase family protein [Burkholderiaceae bacterium]
MSTWYRKARKAVNFGVFVPPVLALLVSACATQRTLAPVEDRQVSDRQVLPSPTVTTLIQPPVAPPAEPVRPVIGGENSGKPGFYTIKPGDTMIRIGLETGQNWKDLVRWNNLDNPNVIEVGQVLRVVAPGADPGVTTRPISPPKVETRSLDGKPVAVAAASASASSSASAAAPAAATPVTPRDVEDDISWQWPAAGSLLASFEEGKAKGLTIAGKVGDPVLAAAEGRVIYAGSGLRGYGNLVILKHNNTYMTAYAHNQLLLVKEDQIVRRGQKIAQMGSTDADRVQLQFEIRRLGKPIDPARLLPPR